MEDSSYGDVPALMVVAEQLGMGDDYPHVTCSLEDRFQRYAAWVEAADVQYNFHWVVGENFHVPLQKNEQVVVVAAMAVAAVLFHRTDYYFLRKDNWD